MSSQWGRRWGIGRGFDIFQKIAVKFPTPGQKCDVKYNWNSPPREMICGHKHEQKFKYPLLTDVNNKKPLYIQKKTAKQYLFTEYSMINEKVSSLHW